MAALTVDANKFKIPINNVSEYNKLYSKEYIDKLENLITKGNYILGKEVEDFEKKLSNYLGVDYSIGLSSGTSALEIAFRLLELNEDDEVVIQANAYIACALGALKSNAKLILIDCDEDGVFDINELKKVINYKTKAVLVVHLYGDCCNMEDLSLICKNNNIILIEDCAQALGSKYNNKMIGSFGDMSCHSFYPSKNLGALGDGGAICTKHTSYYNKIKLLRNLGSIKKYEHELKGTNSRLDTLQAMFLLCKFDDIDNTIIHKQKLAKMYIDIPFFFRHIKNTDEKVHHSYHLYVVKLYDNIERDSFMNYLDSRGIQTLIHYKIPFYKSEAFSELNCLTFKNAEKLADRMVSLPIYNVLSEEEMNYIIGCIQDYDITLFPF